MSVVPGQHQPPRPFLVTRLDRLCWLFRSIRPKVALAILSTLSPELLQNAIMREETAVLQRVPGIGKKTAERIMFQLRDKLDFTAVSTSMPLVSDVDADDAPVFADTTQVGTYGSLALVGGNWTYTLDQSAGQDLDAGDVVTDTITLTASDSTTQDIVITITGTDDAPVVTGTFTGAVDEGDLGDTAPDPKPQVDLADIDIAIEGQRITTIHAALLLPVAIAEDAGRHKGHHAQ